MKQAFARTSFWATHVTAIDIFPLPATAYTIVFRLNEGNTASSEYLAKVCQKESISSKLSGTVTV